MRLALTLFTGLLLCHVTAGEDQLALNKAWLEPISFQADMGFRNEWNWRYEGPTNSPARQARLFQGENVWGSNLVRVVIADRSRVLRDTVVDATLTIRDADDRELYKREETGIRLISAEKGIERPGVFGKLAALGVRRHSEYAIDNTNHVQAFVPYTMTATAFPARITLRMKDPATGTDWGSWAQTFPAYGYVRLHVARCRPFADEPSVPAFLRLWLDERALAAAKVQLRVIDEATGNVARREELTAFPARDLRFDLNLAGLGAGRYRVEAELAGPSNLSDLSSVWMEKRELPKTGQTEIPILVEEMPDFSRTRWPVTGGIPIPDGILPADALDRCRVLDAAGQPTPAQLRTLATWAENRRFARWLLVDFQADSRAGQCGPYRLAVMPKAAPAAAGPAVIRIVTNAAGFQVHTGPVRVEFQDRQGRFMRQVFANAPGGGAADAGAGILDPVRPVSAYMTLVSPDGGPGAAVNLESASSPDIRCELEEAGPLRAVVKVHGAYGRAGEATPMNAFILRFTFWAGRPEIGVEHTFVWKEDPKRWLIQAFGLRWPVSPNTGVWAPAGESNAVTQADLPWSAIQLDSRTNACGGVARAGRFPGWMAVSRPQGGLAVWVKDFWQQYPCGLAAAADGVDLQFWPAAAAPLDLRNKVETYYRGNARGVAKTHQAVLAVHAQSWSPQEVADWAAWQDEPLRAAAHPVAVLESRAFGPLHPYDPARFPADEKALDNAFRGIELQPLETDVYGCMDWGDLHSQWNKAKGEWDRQYRYWLNNESTYDATTISLWMQYARTGRRANFKLCERRTSHLMDVDTCHYSVNQPPHFDGGDPQNHVQVVGLQHRHAEHHWSGGCMAHHTLYDDIVAYYQLTGRHRALDVIREAAANFKTYRPGAENEERGISVPFRLSGDLYWHTWDPDYWRLAVELHDLLTTYSRPNLYGQYGYMRYWLMTGDRRYGLEWLRCSRIQGNVLPELEADDFSRRAVEWDKYVNYPDAQGAAVMYEITGDRRALTRMEQLNFMGPYGSSPGGGKIPVGIEMPLSACFPSDARSATPPGYSWPHLAAFKYAFAMNSLFLANGAMTRPGPLPERELDPPLRTNGRGGGRWTEAGSFAEGRLPGPLTPVTIEPGDTLVFDGRGAGPHAAGLTVSKGAILTFAAGPHALVVQGNVRLEQGGRVTLTPGAALKIDCPQFSRQYGITLAGRLEAAGTSPQARDCAVGALVADGRHDTFIDANRAGGKGPRGFLRHCELDACDMTIADGSFSLAGCRVRKAKLNMQVADVVSNEFEACALRLSANTFSDNRLEGGYAAISPRYCRNNRFARMGRSLWLSGTEFTGNAYRECVDVFVGGQAMFREEQFDGNTIGIRIGGKGPVSFDRCDFGENAPNRNADLEAGSAAVLLKGCRFTPEVRVRVNADGSVSSEDHNGQAGQTRNWGKPPVVLPELAPNLEL